MRNGGSVLVAVFVCAVGSCQALATEPAADFPFLPRSQPYLTAVAEGGEQASSKPAAKTSKASKQKSPRAPSVSSHLQKEANEEALGFNLDANSDSKNLEYMGPFGQILYGPLPMASIEMEMDEDESVLLFYKPAHDGSSFPASLVKDGEQLKGRVSVKGSSTRGFIKKSLLLKLDKETKGDWYGYRKISLNSMSTDPSMLREWLSWDLARASGMNVLNSFYTRLYINKKYIGLFLFTEWVSPEVFDRDGLGTDGELYQPNDATHCGDLSAASLNGATQTAGKKINRGTNCYEKYSPADGNLANLEKLAKGITSTPEGSFHRFVDANFHNDSILNWIAVNGMVGNGDTYNKNYFLYYSNKVAQWEVMPWDFDLSMGRSWDPYLAKPRDVFNDNFVYYYTPDIGFPGQAKTRVLEDPILLERLKRRIAHLLGIGEPYGDARTYGWFSPERVAARVNAIQNYTIQDAQQDPFSTNRIYSYEEQAEAIKYFVLAHYSFLKATTVGDNTNWQYTYDPNQPMVSAPTVASTMSASWTAQRSGYERPLVDKTTGRITAVVKVRSISKPMTITSTVLSFQPPKQLPPGRAANQCLTRSWELTTKGTSPIVADLTFEYLQENSQNSEARGLAGEQKDLQLWLLDGDAWNPQFTRTNSLSKTLTVRNLNLPANRTLQFVACVDAPDEAAKQDSGGTPPKEVTVQNPTVKAFKGFFDRFKRK